MANTKINQLPLYTGDTTGAYLVMNNSGETTTYKVTKENLIGNSYVVLSQVSGSLNFTNDADAATGGVPLGGLYRNGNFIMIRMS
jgi:hypothetical protein